uniref:Protein kinase domain-containing protein n=1 Tax=Macrostomum lignano TaxID=282301 RepID=A0A1I8FRV5_9PLAT
LTGCPQSAAGSTRSGAAELCFRGLPAAFRNLLAERLLLVLRQFQQFTAACALRAAAWAEDAAACAGHRCAAGGDSVRELTACSRQFARGLSTISTGPFGEGGLDPKTCLTGCDTEDSDADRGIGTDHRSVPIRQRDASPSLLHGVSSPRTALVSQRTDLANSLESIEALAYATVARSANGRSLAPARLPFTRPRLPQRKPSRKLVGWQRSRQFKRSGSRAANSGQPLAELATRCARCRNKAVLQPGLPAAALASAQSSCALMPDHVLGAFPVSLAGHGCCLAASTLIFTPALSPGTRARNSVFMYSSLDEPPEAALHHNAAGNVRVSASPRPACPRPACPSWWNGRAAVLRDSASLLGLIFPKESPLLGLAFYSTCRIAQLQSLLFDTYRITYFFN